MGCDIHWVLEIKNRDHWLGLFGDQETHWKAGERWYSFFGELGNARGKTENAIPLRGLPSDISELTEFSIKQGCWDHSYGWLTLDEFLAAYKRACDKCPQAKEEKVTERILFGGRFYADKDKEYRIVFAFDN